MVDSARQVNVEPLPEGTPLCWWCKRQAVHEGSWIYFRGNPVPICPECRNLGQLAVSGLGMLARAISGKRFPS